jgi:DNA polymerase III epsilon subunit-like protein
MKVLIFDTETTGLPPRGNIISQDNLDKWPRIVQFSFIMFDTNYNSISKTRDFIIKMPAGTTIPPESIVFHGITDEIAQEKGVGIEIAFKEFFAALRKADLLVGHNVEFDINMVRVELLRMICNISFPQDASGLCAFTKIIAHKFDLHLLTNFKNIYCTMQESIDLCAIEVKDRYGRTYNKFPKLIELHEKLFKTQPKNLHNSLIDILVTLRCFMQLKYERDILEDCKSYKDSVQKWGFL